MSAVHKLQPRLRRVIVVRQADAVRWRVEGFEQKDAGWQYTWLLVPATTLANADRQAATLAQLMGLPVGRQALGRQIEMCSDVLGRLA